MNVKKSGSRTMLMSVLMSAPGPLIMGFGLMAGRSSTQIADFIRRSAELLGLVMAYVCYRLTAEKSGEARQRLERRSNRFVGAMMCLGGAIMLLLALTSEAGDKGNVIPALAIALLGVVANTIFWRRYTKLNKLSPNAILAVQARLYRAKSLVDGCVTAALLSVLCLPGTAFSHYLDLIGTAVVAVYLVLCGIRTVGESKGDRE